MPPSSSRWPRRGLYAITPDLFDTAALLARVEAALDGGAVLVQYRNKQADAALRWRQACAVQALCARFGAPMLVNDDVGLAQAIAADGVHLGEFDADITSARRQLGAHAILGASCYGELARAERAVAAGADYVAFGAFFRSTTKPQARSASADLLREARPLGVTQVAIGGITADNAGPLIEAGADLVAVISDLFDAPDVAAAARRYVPLFQD